MSPVLAIEVASPSSREAIGLVAALDAYLLGLYPREHTHLLDIDALSRAEVTFLVARFDGLAAGCGAVLRHGRDFIEVKRMFVQPWARGRRVGKAILHGLEQLGRVEAFPLARLETGNAQPEALRFYECMGYRRIGPFGSYSANPVSVFFERDLRDGH